MSHFTVAVFSESPEDVDDLLAPFDENITVEPYISKTKEQIIKDERKSMEEYRTTGCYAEYLKDPEGYKKKYQGNKGHLNYIENVFPKKLKFTDEELYQDAIIGYSSKEITEDGSILSTYNPKSKWDWYQIGGRFSGELKLKGSGKTVDKGYAKDIDFSMDMDRFNDAIRFWEIVVEGCTPTKDEEERYFTIYKKEYYVEKYGTKENYAKEMASVKTYSFLTPDGVWHEPGGMGWFGVSFATEDGEKKYQQEWEDVLKEAIEKNWYMTIVDCHI